MPKHVQRHFVARLHVVTIVFAVLCGFAPNFGKYQFVADDYGIAALSVTNYHGSSLESSGVWRCLGLGMICIGLNLKASIFAALTIAFHALNAVLFYFVIRRLTGHASLAFLAGLLLGVFPGPHEALIWAAASGYVSSTTLFLVATHLVLSGIESSRQWRYFVILTLLVLVQNLTWEHLAFTSMVLGPFILVSRHQGSFKELLRDAGRRFSIWGPTLGALIYSFLFKLTRSSDSLKKIGFNLRSLISPYFYQYTNFYAYDPWLHPETRNFVFFGWNALTIAIAVSCGGAMILALLATALYNNAEQSDGPRLPRISNVTWLIALAVLLAGTSAPYVFAGGFSADSRKQYAFVLTLLLFFSLLWAASRRKFRCPGVGVASIGFLICVLNIPTLWLLTGLWRYENQRYNALIDHLENTAALTEVMVDGSDSLSRAWPRIESFWGIWPLASSQISWITDLTISAKHQRPVKVTDDPSAPLLRYDEASQQWKVVPNPYHDG